MKIVTSDSFYSVRDLAQIALKENLCVSVGGYSWGIKRDLDKIISMPDSEFSFKIWIAYIDDKAVGLALFNMGSKDLMFYVKAAYRRKKVATSLMATIELDRGITQFRVYQGNSSSFHFFNTLGFSPNITNPKATPASIKNRALIRKIKHKQCKGKNE